MKSHRINKKSYPSFWHIAAISSTTHLRRHACVIIYWLFHLRHPRLVRIMPMIVVLHRCCKHHSPFLKTLDTDFIDDFLIPVCCAISAELPIFLVLPTPAWEIGVLRPARGTAPETDFAVFVVKSQYSFRSVSIHATGGGQVFASGLRSLFFGILLMLRNRRRRSLATMDAEAHKRNK